jgi:hypothetical protein
VTAELLSFEDIVELLSKLAPLQVVLIGGQALNYWASVFEAAAPDLTKHGPYASKDIDFQGGGEDVSRSAELLNAKVQALYKRHEDATICSGIVEYTARSGRKIQVDFLSDVGGLTKKEVVDGAWSVELSDGVRVPVMNPIHCLISRAYNVAELSGRDDAHGLNQLQAAVICAREYLHLRAKQERRPALRIAEHLFDFACQREARDIHSRHGIEVFDAVLAWPELGEAFATNRYPQMLDAVRRAR